MNLSYKKNTRKVDNCIYYLQGMDEEYRLLTKVLGILFKKYNDFYEKRGCNELNDELLKLFQDVLSSINFEVKSLEKTTDVCDKLDALINISTDCNLVNNFKELCNLYLEEMKINEFNIEIKVNTTITTDIIKEIFEIIN